MSVGTRRHYDLAEIQRRHWEQTAREVGFPESHLHRLIEDMLDRISNIGSFISSLTPSPSPQVAEPTLRGIRAAAQRLYDVPR